MYVFELLIMVCLGLMAVEQGFWVFLFLWKAKRMTRSKGEDHDFPRVMVVMAIRGRDPHLEECLSSLLNQNYPNYRVHLIVDNPKDPAWGVVQAILKENSHRPVQVEALENPEKTCSLKCSALLQATAKLDPDCEVVAFLDSDVIPDAEWLKKLVTPLADKKIGAAVGIRWFLPSPSSRGSLARFILNAHAVILMFIWKIPWGGSMAMRSSLLKSPSLRNMWAKSASDDVPLANLLKTLKIELKILPNLVLGDQSTCTLKQCSDFYARQYLWVRLYHPTGWWLGLIFILGHLFLQCLCLGLGFFALFQGRWETALLLGAALATTQILSAVFCHRLDLQNRSSLGKAALSPGLSFWTIFKVLPIAIFVSLKAIARAFRIRRVEWRGVHYEIKGPWYIRLVQYDPSL